MAYSVIMIHVIKSFSDIAKQVIMHQAIYIYIYKCVYIYNLYGCHSLYMQWFVISNVINL